MHYLRGMSTPPAAETPQIPTANPIVYNLVVQLTTLPLRMFGRKIDVQGLENLPPPSQPLIIAGNHQSNFDPLLIGYVVPYPRMVQFMAKKELFVPVIGHILRGGGTFPVDRDGNDLGAVRTALRILQSGGTLGIFPQGTRGGQEMHGGAALLALKAKVPIVPVGLSRAPGRWILRFGKPLAPQGNVKALTNELAEQIRILSHPI